MSNAPSRTDKPHEVRYPTAADARGSTRINHLRRPYYLGPFESPQSYIMFGLWKQRLLETGEAPETKDLRPIVERLVSQPSTFAAVTSHRSFIPAVVFGSLCLSFAMIASAIIFSTIRPPEVDNLHLTADETEFIRGMRTSKSAQQASYDAFPASSVAEDTLKLMEEVPTNALHRKRKKGL